MASETSSRRLHTTLVMVHSCDVSVRAFWGIAGVLPDRLLQGQKAIHHLELRLVYLLVGSCFARGTVVGGGRGRGRPGRGRWCRFFILYIFTFLYMRWKSNEVKGTSNLSILKHSNESRRSASNLNTKSFNIKYHMTLENTKY